VRGTEEPDLVNHVKLRESVAVEGQSGHSERLIRRAQRYEAKITRAWIVGNVRMKLYFLR
jgi:hypothetical protein